MIKELRKIKTAQDRDVSLFEMNSTAEQTGKKTILIIGVFHGDEPQGEYLINKFIETKNTPCKNKTLLIPCLNPDGKVLGTRQNSNGIDINRNFPTKNRKVLKDEHYFGGEEAGSEIETKFIIEILEKYKPDFILSLHAPYRVVNYDGDAEEFANKISQITGYPTEADIGYETPGSFGTYAGKERNIPTITLELPEDKTDEELWDEVKNVFNYCTDEI